MSRSAGFKVPEETREKLRQRFQHQPKDFWARCHPEESGCLIRRGTRTEFGYVMAGYQGKMWLAHRLAWTLAHGSIPEGMKVLHRCDNPPCCNPEHLFLGTLSDNIQDCIAKGRYYTHLGEKHPRAKLTSSQVKEIRKAFVPYLVTRKMLAERFGVSASTIKAALCGQNWGHVEQQQLHHR